LFHKFSMACISRRVSGDGEASLDEIHVVNEGVTHKTNVGATEDGVFKGHSKTFFWEKAENLCTHDGPNLGTCPIALANSRDRDTPYLGAFPNFRISIERTGMMVKVAGWQTYTPVPVWNASLVHALCCNPVDGAITT